MIAFRYSWLLWLLLAEAPATGWRYGHKPSMGGTAADGGEAQA